MIEIAAVAMLAGFVQGLSGFAFGLVCTSLWAWMIEPQMLVPTSVLASLIAQCASLHWVRAGLQVRRVAPFLVGGVIGVPAGAAVLPFLNVVAFRITAGLALMLFSTVMLRARRLPVVRSGGAPADFVVGALAGVMGGASGLSGPPMIVWCALRGWAKLAQRATMQAFFIGTQLLSVVIFAGQGLITAQVLITVALIAPAVVVSAVAGAKLALRCDETHLRVVVLALLWLSGAALVAPYLFGTS